MQGAASSMPRRGVKTPLQSKTKTGYLPYNGGCPVFWFAYK